MDPDLESPQRPGAEARPLVKRRWAIVRKAGGGVAVLAMAGAFALSDPSDPSDPGQDRASAVSHIEAES